MHRRPLSLPRLRMGKPWLALPLLIFFLLFVVLPIVMLLATSISGEDGVTLANFRRFFTDGLSLPVLGRTLLLGLETATVALLLGYPLALLFVAASPRFQRLLILSDYSAASDQRRGADFRLGGYPRPAGPYQ